MTIFSSLSLKKFIGFLYELLFPVVLVVMCSPSARTWKGVRANINQTWALNNPHESVDSTLSFCPAKLSFFRILLHPTAVKPHYMAV